VTQLVYEYQKTEPNDCCDDDIWVQSEILLF
jgi:hypothetical protein